jgi:general nucleoside transport system permease protein
MDALWTELFWIGLLTAAVRLATPILLASLGEIIAERAGVLNVGLEGMMLVGAFAGFVAAQGSGSPWAGIVAGLFGGCLLGLLFAFFTVALAVDQIVCGITINLLALGLTGYLHRVIYGLTSAMPKAPSIAQWNIPGLSELPFVGPVLFQQNGLVYLAIVLVLVCWFALFRTTFGLKLRAVGEYPNAADSVGINVFHIRYAAMAACGGLAGLGGAFLSIGQLNMFVEGMTGGRGFIALAVVIFARWNPIGALLAAVLFGAAEALQFRLQVLTVEIPFQFLAMLPYLLTIAVLVTMRRSVQPAALARPFIKEMR